MPIVDPDDGVLAEQPNAVRIAAPEYKGVTVDTRYVPASSLLTNIEGSTWNVHYYSQVLDDDSAIAGQNVTVNPIYQQYRLIRDFELKVTTPLATSQDDDTKTLVLTGSANVYPFVIPNVGDMFLADIGDGKEGLFKVTGSERKSIFKDTCHTIEYQLIDYATPQRLTDLNSKVIQTLQYLKDFLLHGQNPLLMEEDYAVVLKLRGWYHDLLTKYFRWFTSTEFKTLLVPGQDNPTYDPFAAKAVLSFFDTREAPEIRHIRQLNVDGDAAMQSMHLWEAIAAQDPRILLHAFKQAGLVFARSFERNPMLEGIYWSGIHHVVYPKDSELSVDYEFTKNPKLTLTESIVSIPTRITAVADLLYDNADLTGLPYDGAPLIHKVDIDDYYVFSQAFYERVQTGQSRLELCVRDYLDGKVVDNRLLLAFCKSCHAWGAVERFYYIPIILILIKAHIRSI